MESQKESGPSPLLKIALGMIEGYNKADIDAIMTPRASSCTQQVHPARLNQAALNNKQYRKHFDVYSPLLKNYHIEVLDIIEDQRHNKVSLHTRATSQTAIGPYDSECIFVVQTNDDQNQILSIKEFVDSGYSEAFYNKLKAQITTNPWHST